MTTETAGHEATTAALQEISAWIEPGTNEGISWTLSRLTEDLFGASFLAGGDASLFTPSGPRGTICSQRSQAIFFTNRPPSPPPAIRAIQVPIWMSLDLDAGTANLSWADPTTGAPKSATLTIELSKKTCPPEASVVLAFRGDSALDAAAYSLVLILL